MSEVDFKVLYIKTVIVFSISFLYTFIRYNFYGNVPLDDVPTLIFNKSISLTIVFLLAFSLKYKLKGRIQSFEKYSSIIKQLVIVHVVLSLVLLTANYFPKLYIDNKLTLMANISLLSGVLLFSYLLNKIVKPINWIVYLLIATHVLFLGVKGWFTPENWHGSLPPLTLISFVVMVILFSINAIKKNKG